MNIPDEVLDEARSAFYYHHPVLTNLGLEDHAQVIAEWARKEALREAADAVENLPGSTAKGYYAPLHDGGYKDAQRDAEKAIRALAEGVSDGQQ